MMTCLSWWESSGNKAELFQSELARSEGQRECIYELLSSLEKDISFIESQTFVQAAKLAVLKNRRKAAEEARKKALEFLN